MEVYFKEFVEYLQYIGLVTQDTLQSFIGQYNERADNAKNQKENLNYTLLHLLISTVEKYLSSLSQNQMSNIAKCLVGNFNLHKTRIKQKLLFSILKLHSTKIKESYFKLWKYYKVNIKSEYEAMFNKINSSHHQRKRKINSASNNNIYHSNIGQSNFNINESFFTRQEKHSIKLRNNIQRNQDRREQELQLLCTFSPKVNSKANTYRGVSDIYSDNRINSKNLPPKGKKGIDPFERLYQNGDYNYKKNKLSDNKKKGINRNNSKKENKIALLKLYNDHVEYENNKKNLQKEIDEERGMTFKPKSYTKKSGYSVDGNFDERNKKLLEDRENFIFVYDYLRQSKFNEQVIGNKGNNVMKKHLVNTKKEVDDLVQKQHIDTYLDLKENGFDGNFD